MKCLQNKVYTRSDSPNQLFTLSMTCERLRVYENVMCTRLRVSAGLEKTIFAAFSES